MRLSLFGSMLLCVFWMIPLNLPAQNMTQPAPMTAADPAALSGHEPANHPYIIGDDDLLAINVWKEADLSMTIPVRSDGNISLPLAGQLQAAGRTPLQLQNEIRDRLLKYITDPQVTVIVMAMNSQRVNVLGRVMKPGSYTLLHAMTVLDALASAGGFQDFANKKSIYVLRKEPSGHDVRFPFNYKDVIRGKHTDENIRLQANDTVVVP